VIRADMTLAGGRHQWRRDSSYDPEAGIVLPTVFRLSADPAEKTGIRAGNPARLLRDTGWLPEITFDLGSVTCWSNGGAKWRAYQDPPFSLPYPKLSS
jgi:hypothetical protein